ncbi:MAG TPA: cytochrome c [Terriglobales bacterium]|nr:cytochrome c [Terriglobales bacterium]
MRNFVLGMFASVVVVPLVVLLYFVFGLASTQADVSPSTIETQTMRQAVLASVRRSASGLSVPGPASNETLVVGGKLYVAGCVGCHGAIATPLQEDHDHFPPVPQLPYAETQYSEPELYWIVKHGVRMTAMSAYGPFYSEKELWAVAGFLHRIKSLPPEVVAAMQPRKP